MTQHDLDTRLGLYFLYKPSRVRYVGHFQLLKTSWNILSGKYSYFLNLIFKHFYFPSPYFSNHSLLMQSMGRQYFRRQYYNNWKGSHQIEFKATACCQRFNVVRVKMDEIILVDMIVCLSFTLLSPWIDLMYKEVNRQEWLNN